MNSETIGTISNLSQKDLDDLGMMIFKIEQTLEDNQHLPYEFRQNFILMVDEYVHYIHEEIEARDKNHK